MKSKFREHYWITLVPKIIGIFLVIGFFIYIAKDKMENFDVSHVFFWLSLGLFVTILILVYRKIKHDIKSIEISSENITFNYIITGKKEIIKYEEIINIKTVRRKRAHPDSQSFHRYNVTEIHLSNDTFLEIIHSDYKNIGDLLKRA